MKLKLIVVAAVLGAGLLLAARPPQDKPDGAGGDPMAMFAGAAKYLTPDARHEWLGQFVGDWDVTFRMIMAPGMPAMESHGTATVKWLIDGRWLIREGDTPVMGSSVRHVTILGHDNFKQKYVSMTVDSFQTCMLTAEGFRDQHRTSLHLYGPLDEYLTGENDKPVRYTWRIDSPDKHVLEVHDLAIGLENTKVVEIEYTRKR